MEENEQEIQYIQCAMKLAADYSRLLEEHDRLIKRLDGNWVYTREMAIADLDSLTVSYDMERVQSSNISNPSERIALMLTDEYLQRKQEEYNREHDRCLRECEYVDWKLDIVETAFRERMNDLQRRIFKLVFIQGLSFREIRAALQEKICNRQIVETKKKIWQKICWELQAQMLRNSRYIKRLMMEVNQKGRITDGTNQSHSISEGNKGENEPGQEDGQRIYRGKVSGTTLPSKAAHAHEAAPGNAG